MDARLVGCAAALSLGLAACASSARETPTPILTSSTMAVGDSTEGRGRAYALVIGATGCWLDGLWSDALGEAPGAREEAIRQRCEDVLRSTGESPTGSYPAFRAVDAATVERVHRRVRDLAERDPVDSPNAEELAVLFDEVANVSRETVQARAAADKVKQVFEDSPAATTRQEDKREAAKVLGRRQALLMVLMHHGTFMPDANAIGALHALDRMEIARGLPKHLKVVAAAAPVGALFGVDTPQLSSDASQPIPTGTWMTYLVGAAHMAGHSVPADARDPQNIEPLAWNGVLVGMADRLRNAHTHSTLDAVAKGVVARIDAQAAAERAAYEAHAPADR